MPNMSPVAASAAATTNMTMHAAAVSMPSPVSFSPSSSPSSPSSSPSNPSPSPSPVKRVDPFLKFSHLENGAIGLLSGSIEVCMLQPMLYWKNASQQGQPFTLNPRLLYRGLGVSVANMAVLTGLQFPLTSLMSSLITRGEHRRMTNAEMVGASFLGGAFSGLACGPMEVVMIQQQRFGGSMSGTFVRLVKNFGAISLTRGITMACGREAFFTAGCLGISPVVKRELEEHYGMQSSHAKVAGSITAGVIAGTLSHPLDTIKTCMQGDVERKRYGGALATGRMLMQEGLARLFSGWGWRTGRMMGSFFVLSECKQLLSPVLFPHHFSDS